ncbi:hypothetical protein H311_04117, partial [Anncaliia algerae PRA109]
GIKFSHKRLDDRLRAYDFVGESIGENIAKQQDDNYQEVLNLWILSKDHHKNIYGDYDYTGVSTCKDKKGNRYWVQVFGKESTKENDQLKVFLNQVENILRSNPLLAQQFIKGSNKESLKNNSEPKDKNISENSSPINFNSLIKNDNINNQLKNLTNDKENNESEDSKNHPMNYDKLNDNLINRAENNASNQIYTPVNNDPIKNNNKMMSNDPINNDQVKNNNHDNNSINNEDNNSSKDNIHSDPKNDTNNNLMKSSDNKMNDNRINNDPIENNIDKRIKLPQSIKEKICAFITKTIEDYFNKSKEIPSSDKSLNNSPDKKSNNKIEIDDAVSFGLQFKK